MVLNKELQWFWQNPVHFVIEAARWTRFRLHVDMSQAPQERFWPGSAGGRLLVVLMAPMGVA